MALRAYLVVFATTVDNPEEVLPDEKELKEAFKDYLDIPDEENTTVDLWRVNIEAMGFEEGKCRQCGNDCADGRLFCDKCAADIAGQPVEQ